MRDFPGCWELESDLDLGAVSCEPQAGALPVRLLDAPAPVPLQSALHSSSSTLCPGLVLQIIPQSQAGLRPALPCSLPCSPPLPPGRPPGWCGRKEERPSVRPFLHFSSQKQVFSVEMPTASRLHRPFPARLSSANGPAGPVHTERSRLAPVGEQPQERPVVTGQGPVTGQCGQHLLPRDRLQRASPHGHLLA